MHLRPRLRGSGDHVFFVVPGTGPTLRLFGCACYRQVDIAGVRQDEREPSAYSAARSEWRLLGSSAPGESSRSRRSTRFGGPDTVPRHTEGGPHAGANSLTGVKTVTRGLKDRISTSKLRDE